jgi:hypothetical protein
MQSGQAAGSSTLNKTKTAHWAGRGKWHSCQQPDEPSVTNTIVAGMHTGMAAPLSLVQLPDACTATSATVIRGHTCSQLPPSPTHRPGLCFAQRFQSRSHQIRLHDTHSPSITVQQCVQHPPIQPPTQLCVSPCAAPEQPPRCHRWQLPPSPAGTPPCGWAAGGAGGRLPEPHLQQLLNQLPACRGRTAGKSPPARQRLNWATDIGLRPQATQTAGQHWPAYRPGPT